MKTESIFRTKISLGKTSSVVLNDYCFCSAGEQVF